MTRCWVDNEPCICNHEIMCQPESSAATTTGSPLDEIERLERENHELRSRVYKLEDYIAAARAVLAKVLPA